MSREEIEQVEKELTLGGRHTYLYAPKDDEPVGLVVRHLNRAGIIVLLVLNKDLKNKEEIKKILNLYMSKYYDEADDQQTWFGKMKDMAEELGYAREVKEYKKEPEKWPGHVGDISTVLRVAITRRRNTPDLYEIMHVLGKANVEKRIELITK